MSFARHFIGNPELVLRWRDGRSLARVDRKTFYTGAAEGYGDYACVAADGQ